MVDEPVEKAFCETGIGNIAVRKDDVKLVFVDKTIKFVSVFSSVNFVLVSIEDSIQGLQNRMVGIDAQDQASSIAVLRLRVPILRRRGTVQRQFDGKGSAPMGKIADANGAAVFGHNSIADA